jgi:hypothetical protein
LRFIPARIPCILERKGHPKNTERIGPGWFRNLRDWSLSCPKCRGQMRIVAFIEDEEVIKKILKHLGLWEVKARPPPRAKGTSVTIYLDDSDS